MGIVGEERFQVGGKICSLHLHSEKKMFRVWVFSQNAFFDSPLKFCFCFVFYIEVINGSEILLGLQLGPRVSNK